MSVVPYLKPDRSSDLHPQTEKFVARREDLEKRLEEVASKLRETSLQSETDKRTLQNELDDARDALSKLNESIDRYEQKLDNLDAGAKDETNYRGVPYSQSDADDIESKIRGIRDQLVGLERSIDNAVENEKAAAKKAAEDQYYKDREQCNRRQEDCSVYAGGAGSVAGCIAGGAVGGFAGAAGGGAAGAPSGPGAVATAIGGAVTIGSFGCFAGSEVGRSAAEGICRAGADRTQACQDAEAYERSDADGKPRDRDRDRSSRGRRSDTSSLETSERYAALDVTQNGAPSPVYGTSSTEVQRSA